MIYSFVELELGAALLIAFKKIRRAGTFRARAALVELALPWGIVPDPRMAGRQAAGQEGDNDKNVASLGRAYLLNPLKPIPMAFHEPTSSRFRF